MHTRNTMTGPNVDYNFLGKSGLKVSNLCLGCMTFGQDPAGLPTQANEELSHQILDKYAELGGNFLDTADIYSRGQSEEIVGNWLSKNDRSKFVLATKVRMPTAMDVNCIGLSRRHIIDGCEQSLQKLKTPYIDLYQSHCWDNATPINETLRTFDDLVRCGKVRYFGVSNVCGWQLQKIVDRIETMGLNSCISLQQQYSLLARQSEFDEFMVCANEGIGVLPWSPLKGGLLTGKYKRDEIPDASTNRIGYVHTDEKKASEDAPAWSKYSSSKEYWKLIDTLKEIAETHGKSIPQVSLRWLIQQEVVASVIIGATSVKQLVDNMGASRGWELTTEEMARLNEVGPRVNMYPYEMIWELNTTRYNRYNRSIDIKL